MAQKAKKTKDESEKLERLRHSLAHIMADAVLSLAIDNGFYYDFELPRPLTPEDLQMIADKMKQAIAADTAFVRQEVSKEEARRIFEGQPFKLELIDEIEEEKVCLYKQSDFLDLCRGPHLGATGEARTDALKLTTIAGAYWRGDEKRPMLQRIYGVAFDSRKALKEHLGKLEEAARRDHRKLGRELDLYSIHQEVGPGLVHWHPKGATVRRLIEDFWKEEHLKRDYDIVYTPHIAKLDLWKTSGHWEFYRDSLYSPMEVEGDDYIVKPMNCLFHILIYKTKRRSYRELPIRYAELGTVYRYERSGVLHGISRVRGFTQDDAHIFCRFDQLEDEVAAVLELALFMIDTFGFSNYDVLLSTRPDKYTGSEEIWEQATDILSRALKRRNIDFEIDPGEGVFYGPKIDIKFEDAVGRAWQGPTIQVDFNLPQRFGVSAVGEDGQEQSVAMVHRTVLGSMERFIGSFPVWLAPVQVVIIPIADRHLDYAATLSARLKKDGRRVEVDDRQERVGHKIRQAQLAKVPYMLVVGDDEVAEGTVSVRLRSGEQKSGYPIEDFMKTLARAVKDKAKELTL